MKFIKSLLLCTLTFSLSSFASSRHLGWYTFSTGGTLIENANGSWTYIRSFKEIISMKKSIASAAEDARNIPWLESHIQILQTERDAHYEVKRRCNASLYSAFFWLDEVGKAIDIGTGKLEKIKKDEKLKKLEQAHTQEIASRKQAQAKQAHPHTMLNQVIQKQ